MKTISNKNVLETFFQASEILYNALAHTLGPRGYNTAVNLPQASSTGRFSIINDGYTIISMISHPDKEVASAIEVIKEVAVQTNAKAGDGTTSSVIFIYNLLRQMVLEQPTENYLLIEELKETKNLLLETLPDHILNPDQYLIADLIKTSMGSDHNINTLIAEAFEYAGNQGDVQIKRVKQDESFVSKIDTTTIDSIQIISPELLPSEDIQAKVVLVQAEIKSINEITPLLTQIRANKSPVVLIAEKYSQNVIEFLYKNIISADIPLFPYLVNGSSKQKSTTFKLLESIFDTKVFDQLVRNISIMSLDTNKDYKLVAKIDRLLAYGIDQAQLTLFCEENKVSIPTRLGEINLASNNSIVSEELFMRVEDTINSVKRALVSGAVIGGGNTYRNLYVSLADHLPTFMESPLCSIVAKVASNANIQEEELYNIEGVCDSVEVVRQVISNSIDIVCSILSTKVMLVDLDI